MHRCRVMDDMPWQKQKPVTWHTIFIHTVPRTLPLWPALSHAPSLAGSLFLSRSLLTKCNFAFDRQTNVKIYTCSCSTNAKHHRIFLSIVSFCTKYTHTHTPSIPFSNAFHSFSISTKWPCIIQSTLRYRILHQFFIVPLSLFRWKISFSLIFAMLCPSVTLFRSISHSQNLKMFLLLISSYICSMFSLSMHCKPMGYDDMQYVNWFRCKMALHCTARSIQCQLKIHELQFLGDLL